MLTTIVTDSNIINCGWESAVGAFLCSMIHEQGSCGLYGLIRPDICLIHVLLYCVNVLLIRFSSIGKESGKSVIHTVEFSG